jgi:uncharacterized protein (DUF1810 family)
MITKQQVEGAKEAFDLAWDEAVKLGAEVQEAIDRADQLQGTAAADTFKKKAARALKAHDNWLEQAQRASQMLQSYYQQFMRK